MEQDRIFSVLPCGFVHRDQLLLSSAFKLSSIRVRKYEILDPEEDLESKPDLFIVNDDDPAGWELWRSFASRFNILRAPVLSIGQHPTPQQGSAENDLHFKRPIVASRLLKAVDELITQAYQYTPELVISDQMDTARMQTLMASSATGELRSDKSGGQRRILVVDDSESVRQLMGVKLKLYGAATEFAEDGESALKMARDKRYDLIFLDVMLPGIDGYEVCRKLKREQRITNPVVMLTSRNSRIDKLKGSLASCDGYLTKPLSNQELEKTLERYLRSS